MKRGYTVAVAALLTSLLSSTVVDTQTISEFQPNLRWGGRAVSIAVHPTNAAYAIVASESGGLFKTWNRGANWAHINSLPPFRMSDVKYAPTSPPGRQVVIATAWSDSRTMNGGGIWRSEDGGDTWTKPATSNPPAGARCTARATAWGIAFEPGSTNVYVGTDCGIAISRDLGATWEHRIPDPDVRPNNRVFSVVAQRGGIVDICGDNGPYRSITGGRTWRVINADIGACQLPAVHAIEVSPAEANVIFVTTAVNNLFESDDGGLTWTNLTPPAGGARESWVRAGRARDDNSNNFDLYYGNGTNTVRQTCTNSGGTRLRCSRSAWTPVMVDDADHNDLAFSIDNNCPLYMASDGGVHVTTDCGGRWTLTGGGRGGFNALQLYEVAGQIQSDGHVDLYIGTQDNDLWASPDGGLTWTNNVPSEGFGLQMERRTTAHDGQTITAVRCWPCSNFSSPAHFATFSGWSNPPGNGGGPVIIDRGAYFQFSMLVPPATILYLTNDTGARWSTAGNFAITLSGRPHIVGPPDDPIIYQAVTRPGSTAGGDPITGLIRITGVRRIGSLRTTRADWGMQSIGIYSMGQGTFGWPVVFGADPNNPDHLIAPDVGTSEMKVSTDGGVRWTADDPGMRQLTDLVRGGGTFRFNIPQNEDRIRASPGVNLQVHAIAFDPFNRNQIFVGTEAAGIIRSTDGGRTWATLPGSQHITGITSFFFIENSYADPVNTVLVSTYGRGLWKLRIPSPRRPFLLPEEVAIAWSTGWIRDRYTSDIITIEQFLDPDYCPICQYLVVSGGRIMNVRIGESGIVERLMVDDGKVLVSSADGKQLPLELPVEITKEQGNFENCPGCLEIIKKGGSVKGLIVGKGQVRAIIAGFKDLPGENALWQSAPQLITTQRSAPAQDLDTIKEPYVQIVGTIPVSGVQGAATGDTITVYGSNFLCDSERCPPVELSVGDRVVAKDVKVDSKGSFKFSVLINERPGSYFLTATQISGQTKLTDRKLLVVPVKESDQR